MTGVLDNQDLAATDAQALDLGEIEAAKEGFGVFLLSRTNVGMNGEDCAVVKKISAFASFQSWVK